MAEDDGAGTGRKRRGRRQRPPLALEPIDLLAGLAPGVELEADPVPPGLAGAEDGEPATADVNDVGRLLRVAEPTVRRLIRTPAIRPGEAAPDAEPMNGPFVPHLPDKPSE